MTQFTTSPSPKTSTAADTDCKKQLLVFLFSGEPRRPTLAEEKDTSSCRDSLLPALLIKGLFSNSFRLPKDTTFPKISAEWHNMNPFAQAECKSNRLTSWPIGCCGSFIPQDRFVTKWASCEYHLGSTFFKAGRRPVAASLAMTRRE